MIPPYFSFKSHFKITILPSNKKRKKKHLVWDGPLASSRGGQPPLIVSFGVAQPHHSLEVVRSPLEVGSSAGLPTPLVG